MARRRVWVPIFNSASLAAGTQVKVDLLQNLGLDLESVGGLTITRMVGEFKFRCDVVSTYQSFGAGIAVVHEDLTAAAMNIGNESLPLLWSILTATSGLFSESAAGNFDGIFETRMIDSRAQRKVAPQHTLSLFVNNGAGQAIQFAIGIRTLVLLP